MPSTVFETFAFLFILGHHDEARIEDVIINYVARLMRPAERGRLIAKLRRIDEDEACAAELMLAFKTTGRQLGFEIKPKLSGFADQVIRLLEQAPGPPDDPITPIRRRHHHR